MVEVLVTAATICFAGECHPALVGVQTPRGEFTLARYRVRDRRYGGDVLEFKRDGAYAFSVHRTWPGREKLYALPAERRRAVTLGCINVEPETFRRLVECCEGKTINIK